MAKNNTRGTNSPSDLTPIPPEKAEDLEAKIEAVLKDAREAGARPQVCDHLAEALSQLLVK